jgi:hypothetical protein
MDNPKIAGMIPTTKKKYRRLWSHSVFAITALLLTIWSAVNFRADDPGGLPSGF